MDKLPPTPTILSFGSQKTGSTRTDIHPFGKTKHTLNLPMNHQSSLKLVKSSADNLVLIWKAL